MGIRKALNNISQFLWEAAARTFAPNDDAYPEVGVQPFEGKPARDNQKNAN